MNDPLLSMLGIAKRAGRLSCGFDAAADSMKKGRSSLLIIAADVSERTKRSASDTALSCKTPYVICSRTMEQLGRAVGRRTTGIISIDDRGFAEKLKTLCADNRQEECIDD